MDKDTYRLILLREYMKKEILFITCTLGSYKKEDVRLEAREGLGEAKTYLVQ